MTSLDRSAKADFLVLFNASESDASDFAGSPLQAQLEAALAAYARERRIRIVYDGTAFQVMRSQLLPCPGPEFRDKVLGALGWGRLHIDALRSGVDESKLFVYKRVVALYPVSRRALHGSGLLKAFCAGLARKLKRGGRGETTAPRAVEPLISALADGDSNVRAQAAESLGELGDRRAIEPLVSALFDENSHVRKMAQDALNRLGWKPMTEQLEVNVSEEQVWVYFPHTLNGPFSPDQFRRMAEAGHVTPETPVSVDGKRWVVAANVSGITFGELGKGYQRTEKRRGRADSLGEGRIEEDER